jgi:hypothetical protein
MSKGHKYTLGATVEPKLVQEIDAIRGEVPRSRVIERALNEYLARQKSAIAEESAAESQS